ncbi:MAG: hypothetical protein L0Y35_05710, partial [Flammeovirgaceae bacterium]|nr:hypothetical protein [Flammeovirgaceae bacterium]
GLYNYRGSIVGVQNVLFPEAIHQLELSEDDDKITKVKLLSAFDPHLNIPTTGAFAEHTFYFIGNSQLLQIIGTKGKIKEPEKLTETYIMKIRLN